MYHRTQGLYRYTSACFCLSLWVLGSNPAIAQLDSPSTSTTVTGESESIIIPSETVIAVMLKTPINFVPEAQGGTLPMTGYLILPIQDAQGTILAPKNALVSLLLAPQKDSADLVANGIVIGGRLIPIQTLPLVIPAQRGEFTFDNEYVPNPGRLNEISTNLLGVTLSSDAIDAPIRAGLGLGFGLLAGVTAPKGKRAPKMITIEGESVYILVTNNESEIPSDLNLDPQINAVSEEEF